MHEKKHDKKKPVLAAGILDATDLGARLKANPFPAPTSSTSPISGKKCDIHRDELDDLGECEECNRQAAERAANAKKAQAIKIEKILGGIRLGKRYRGKGFDQYLPTCSDAEKIKAKCQGFARTFSDRLDAGDNLLMLGNFGTGKNALAAAICQEIALGGFTSVHTTVLKMLRRIKSTWHKKSDELEQDVIDAFILPDLLVVDEIGVQFDTVSEKLLIFEALNGRYEEQKPTILISNLVELADLSTFLGARVMDRMREGQTGILRFTWESYRGR